MLLPLPPAPLAGVRLTEGFLASCPTGSLLVSLLTETTDVDKHDLTRRLLLLLLAATRLVDAAFMLANTAAVVAVVASKLRLFDKRDHIHSAGDFYSVRGVPGNRGAWQPDHGQFDSPYVFGACGAASVYKRSMLDQIGLLDDRFQFSCEDVDLAWRAQLAGYKCAFAHDAIVYHKVSATGGGVLNSYYDGRNFIWLLAKDVPSEILRSHWRQILGEQWGITRAALRAWRGEAARMRLKGQLAGLIGLPRALSWRRATQANRNIDQDTLQKLLSD